VQQLLLFIEKKQEVILKNHLKSTTVKFLMQRVRFDVATAIFLRWAVYTTTRTLVSKGENTVNHHKNKCLF